MALALRRYRNTLLASRLIEPDELRAFEDALPRDRRPKTPEDLTQALIEAQKLTPFQAAEIATGRGRGLVLGNYVLLERIGAGGMGQVFKAWHRRMQRVVALKTLPNEAAAGEDSIARFRREILSAAQLTHPNIVAAYDADVAAGIHFLVMEYIAGKNLADLLRQRGPLAVAQAVKYVVDAARGLAYAHARGMVHRDVKPSNLIVDEADTVKVLDLGLARPAAGFADLELTSPGDVVGTLEYMAPEQATSSAGVDRRADIYGLGCTLYRLVTGELPYRGGSPLELIAAHREQQIPALGAVREDVPRALDAVFKRMVAKQADERYALMDEVVGELEKLRLNGRARSWRRSDAAVRAAPLATASNVSSSGDDIELASSLWCGPPARSAKPDGRPAQSPTPPQDVADAARCDSDGASSPVGKQSTVRPGVSPAIALVTLLAALAGMTSLSWFDSRRNTDSTGQEKPGNRASAYPSASAWQRAWAQSLAVPLELSNSVGMRFVLVPPDDAAQDVSDAAAAPFYFAVHEVTVAQYRQFLEATGGVHGASVADAAGASGDAYATRDAYTTRQGDRHPAVGLTAEDAENYCLWLSARESANYRLPSDAEFARACRAGAADVSWFRPITIETSRFAWYKESSGGRTHQIGLLEPNPLGLHDLLGNAPEWCRLSESQAAGETKLATSHELRGGSWSSPLEDLAGGAETASGMRVGGLRLVLDLPLEAHWP